MTRMDQDQPGADSEFERLLLDSARSDSLPTGATDQAWVRFSGSMTAATLSAVGVPAAGLSTARGGGFLSRLGAGKCLLLGVLGGSALTFAWFGAHRSGAVLTTRGATELLSNQASSSVAETASSGVASLNQAAPAPTVRAPRTANASPVRRSVPAPSRESSAGPAASARTEPTTPPPSTLTAEVAALDAARAATQAGAYTRALDLLSQYRTDFPAGVLKPDAEVASIEALSAMGDHVEASRRASRFLVQFPNDPHSAKVRRLLGP